MAKIYDKWRVHAIQLFQSGHRHTDIYEDPDLWRVTGLSTPSHVGIDRSTLTAWRKKAEAQPQVGIAAAREG